MLLKTCSILLISGSLSLAYALSPRSTNYFQQHVDYRINAKLDIALNRIDATQTLIYTNNSPDTLSQLHFHLYLNKYEKGAYHYRGRRTHESASIDIFEIRENDSIKTVYMIDHTLLHLPLNEKLLPGDSVNLFFKFAAKLPQASGRYGYYGDHYDVGNWYPTPVVYDREGWHLHQHIDNEFYQEWGDFRVDIRVPKGFILGATGNLLNPEKALRDTSASVREWYRENPSDTSTTLWKFSAPRVHDFAWTADPGYVLFQNEWNGITLNVLAMDHNAREWKQVTEFGVDALKYLSETFGEYPYKQLTIADTYIRAGGMEYPGIAFINTYTSPLYALNHFRAVIIHEMAHNWFYGLLASNQTEEEWLDEGFTTMAEILCMEHLFGCRDNYSYNTQGWLRNRLKLPVSIRRYSALQYLRMVKQGNERDPINLMPDLFRGDVYTSQYEKMANVLFMLQTVVGDSLFFKGLRRYYEEWRFRHPYPEDFFRIMEITCKRDLDWFFEQWLNTTRTLDYAVKEVSVKGRDETQKGSYHVEIVLERIGDIFMPLDVDIVLKNGIRHKLHIPVDLKAKPDRDRRILEYWHFTQERYTMELKLSDALDYVIIDPGLTLLDVNRLNNRSGILPPMSFTFMRPRSYYPNLDSYSWEGWPLFFYNDVDKIKAGFKLRGSYLNIDHRLSLNLWLKAASQNIDFHLSYSNPLNELGNGAEIGGLAYILDGRQGAELYVSKSLGQESSNYDGSQLGLKISTYKVFNNRYPLVPWDRGDINTMCLYFNAEAGDYLKTDHRIEVWYRNAMMNSNFRFSSIFLGIEKKITGRTSATGINMRLSAGYADGDIPYQHRFSLSGGTAFDNFEHLFYRSRGSLPYPLFRKGNLYHKRYAGVRGSTLHPEFGLATAERILALNWDLHFNNPIRYSPVYLLRDLNPFLFHDLGNIWSNNFPSFNRFLKSAGFGFYYDRLGLTGTILNIERIQAEFPVWMSHAPDDEQPFAWRWLLHVDMSL